MIEELVTPIKGPVSLPLTVVDRAGELGTVMFFPMTSEVAGAGEGCVTVWLVTPKAMGIGVGIGRSGGGSADGKGQRGGGVNHFTNIGLGDIEATKVIMAAGVERVDDDVELAVRGNIVIYGSIAIGGLL